MLMFPRENIFTTLLEIKASKLLEIMYKIFSNEKPKSKHNVLLVCANHVRQESLYVLWECCQFIRRYFYLFASHYLGTGWLVVTKLSVY